jgi:hypothetical protein
MRPVDVVLLALPATFAVQGCSEPRPAASGGDAGVASQSGSLNETATFQSLSMIAGGGLCPTWACGEAFVVDSQGLFRHGFAGRVFEAQLPAADLASISALAVSRGVIQALRRLPPCPGVPDGGEATEVEFAPGLFASADTVGCTDGSIVELRSRLHALAKRLFPESGTQPTRPGAPEHQEPYLLNEPLRFLGLTLQSSGAFCLPSRDCFERIIVSPDAGQVTTAGGDRPSRIFTGVADFSPVDTSAISPAVVAEMRRSRPCGLVSDAAETIEIFVGPQLRIRADTTACSMGPIAELRSGMRTLVDRLLSSPVPDAAAADGAPDVPRP